MKTNTYQYGILIMFYPQELWNSNNGRITLNFFLQFFLLPSASLFLNVNTIFNSDKNFPLLATC